MANLSHLTHHTTEETCSKWKMLRGPLSARSPNGGPHHLDRCDRAQVVPWRNSGNFWTKNGWNSFRNMLYLSPKYGELEEKPWLCRGEIWCIVTYTYIYTYIYMYIYIYYNINQKSEYKLQMVVGTCVRQWFTWNYEAIQHGAQYRDEGGPWQCIPYKPGNHWAKTLWGAPLKPWLAIYIYVHIHMDVFENRLLQNLIVYHISHEDCYFMGIPIFRHSHIIEILGKGNS